MEGRDEIKGWRKLHNLSYEMLQNRERHYYVTKIYKIDNNLCKKQMKELSGYRYLKF